ncbi:hypothetical protein NL676_036027 [Syzygium grande]|nr:hypothetical protein NL676_036027 [Syzygium grande]
MAAGPPCRRQISGAATGEGLGRGRGRSTGHGEAAAPPWRKVRLSSHGEAARPPNRRRPIGFAMAVDRPRPSPKSMGEARSTGGHAMALWPPRSGRSRPWRDHSTSPKPRHGGDLTVPRIRWAAVRSTAMARSV